MLLHGVRGRGGFDPQRVSTTAKVHIERVDQGFKITKSVLSTEAEVPGIDQAKFTEIAEGAKANCPVSQALAGVDISLEAKLLS